MSNNDAIIKALREALDRAEKHPDFLIALELLKVKVFLTRAINEN